MKAFIEPLQELSGYEDMTKAAMQPGLVTISGCIDAQKPHMIYTLGRTRSRRLIVTFHEQKAKELYDDYRFFDPSVVYYPAKDVLFYQSDIRGNLLTAERISALRAIHENEQVTVITTFDALMNTMPRDAQVWDSVLHIAQGDTLDLDALVEQLVRMGYERQYQVDNIGQFALRGGILDIFPLTEENPVRIELWDDEVDTLRTFDVESQKSIENIEKLVVYPACELVLSTEEKAEGIRRLLKEAEAFSDKLRKEMKTEEAYRAQSQAKELAQEWEELSETAGMDAFLSYFCRERWSLLDYFDPADTFVFFDELSRSAERGRQTELEFSESMKQRLEMGYILPGQMNELFGYKEIMGRLEKYSCCAVSALDIKTCGLKSNGQFGIHVKSVSAYNNSFELLIADLKKYKKNGYRIILLSGSRTRAKRLAEDILNEGLNCFYTEDYDHDLVAGQIMVCYGKVHQGYEYPILQFAVITDTDIFGEEKKKKKRHRTYEGEKIQQFTDLSVGDYVVHENHGLGIYKGIEKIEVDRKVKDYIKIEYAGGSNLYILATQLDQIQKYAGKDARKPKLNKLGSQEWTKTKGKVRGAVRQIAQDLVKLYAEREEQNGYMYGPDTVWQREFEELFPFEETEDQVLAIDATKRDMESHKIMDRLICGDVGYGKTEIAIRAAFKAVQDIRKSSLTFAPEAGTQRMRNVINKGLTEENILTGAMDAFRGGWNRVKLYFMLGLPGETYDDIEGIAILSDKIAREYYTIPKDERNGKVSIVTAQFGDQVAIRTGNGGHRAAVLVVESDTVESVLIYGIGENRCKLIGLRVIETREVDILPVRQDGEHDFDALSLQTGYIGGSTAVFEQVGHLVVQIEGRTHYSVDRLLVEIGGEELHDIGIGRTVGEQVVAGIKRVHVVGLDINGDLRSFVPVSTCFDDRFLGLVHRRFFCLLAGDHHRCTGCQCCE